MEEEKFLVEEKGPYRVSLIQDMDAMNPRGGFDNAGKMVCWHRRYELGDKHNFSSNQDFQDWWEDNGKGGVILPLALMDHSGLSMWVGSGPSVFDPGGWDSGQVGWIYATKETIESEWGKDKKAREQAKKYLEGEVEVYNCYLTGDVYGYVLEGPEGEIDSCWGFYGHKDAEEEAKRVLAAHLKGDVEEIQRIEEFIQDCAK
jgi:hypothetical protein